ncbi:anti sigma factor C-terminal domain-containing protein [Bacillus sp. REN10]|uniref:anti sigma factor C-terminal domain-containing protein n=1 Tax=Bacillus sp. REN10 TaxID=2782541 RepID=UPI00193C8455|nr:anti sigma factor C-terminal domain-containing protein [Bacillus sp. REN10]
MKNKSIFEQDDAFSDLVKKAKRKSIKRNIIISLLVTISTLVFLWILLYIGQYFMYERMYEDTEETNDGYRMYGANVYPSGASYDYFFVVGRSNASAYKEVNGHLINWDSRSSFHTILGTKATVNTSSFIDENDSTYKNDYKMVKFHLPNKETVHDDLSYLKTLPGFYSVEIALSFHKEIPLRDVEQAFPTASWVWLLQDHLYEDSASTDQANSLSVKQDFSEVDGDQALGFPVEPNTLFKEGATQYTTFLKEKSEDLVDAKDVSQMLKQYDPDQIPIAGVILTGTVDEVLPYTTKPSVRVVRTGVIIPY